LLKMSKLFFAILAASILLSSAAKSPIKEISIKRQRASEFVSLNNQVCLFVQIIGRIHYGVGKQLQQLKLKLTIFFVSMSLFL